MFQSLLDRFLQRILIFVIVLSLSAVGWSVPSARAHQDEEQHLVLQAWRIVNQAYLDETFNHQNWWFVRRQLLREPLQDREATYKAIEEMLAGLEDPFTRLLPPDRYRSLQVNTSGELSGIGVQIDYEPKAQAVEVIAPIAGSPAEAAGIEPLDLILAIDGVETATLDLEEAAARLRGDAGTSVRLLVQPRGQTRQEARLLEVHRDRIALSSVYARLDTRNPEIPLGYIRLAQFSASAAPEVSAAIANLEREGARGFILDLRNNPGGLLQAGVEIARLWLDSGAIVYTVNRQGTLGSYDANGTAATQSPLAVLVNEGTASASEILAGALQDNGRAVLVGETTFGKGLIQSLFELDDGAGMAVTVAKYETPNHTDINKVGIHPDYEIDQDDILRLDRIGGETDCQYRQAVEVLTSNLASDGTIAIRAGN